MTISGTSFSQNGKDFRPFDGDSTQIHKLLPGAVYMLVTRPFIGYVLHRVDDFLFDGKVYGNIPTMSDKIINTFKDRPASTGVMLTGPKGTGKSMLAKLLGEKCVNLGIPVIIINNDFTEDANYFPFLQSISQETMILFDEFEKTHNKDAQERILTLLDGTFPSKKLFVLTTNYIYRVDENMNNRPGRIYYSLAFESLEPKFITEYCEDHGIDEDRTHKMVLLTKLFDTFTFDMLKAVVEEMKRYDQTPAQAIEMLNVKPETSGRSEFEVSIMVDGVELNEELFTSTVNLNPYNGHGHDIYIISPKDNCPLGEEEGSYNEVEISTETLQNYDAASDSFVYFETIGGHKVITKLSAKKIKKMSYGDGFFDYGAGGAL